MRNHLYRFAARLRPGFFLKWRALRQESPWKTLLPEGAEPLRLLETHERVVIVGAGIAAMTLMERLARAQHTAITIVSPDEAWGGKCVHEGCMPSEFFAAHTGLSADQRLSRGRELSTKLATALADRMAQLKVEIVRGTAVSVDQKNLKLEDGRLIPFDRLVLALGAETARPQARFESLVEAASFWKLQGGSLLVWSDSNLASLSYADMWRELGFEATVIFEDSLPLSHLPSIAAYIKGLRAKGIRIEERVKVTAAHEKEIQWTSAQGRETLRFDSWVDGTQPRPRGLMIDGVQKTFRDVSLLTSQLRGRPDICFLGDAAGLWTASEAEAQARALAEAWIRGDQMNPESWTLIPSRLHGSPSLAFVGEPWTLLEKNWRSLDFNRLGWSAVHNQAGKIWFLPEGDHVAAFHILHPEAGRLIESARLLLGVPVQDPRWRTFTVHPEAAEIFPLIAEELRPFPTRTSSVAPPARRDLIQLPHPTQILNDDRWRAWIRESEWRDAILDREPALYLALVVAAKMIKGDAAAAVSFSRGENDELASPTLRDLQYHQASSERVHVSLGTQHLIVECETRHS